MLVQGGPDQQRLRPDPVLLAGLVRLCPFSPCPVRLCLVRPCSFRQGPAVRAEHLTRAGDLRGPAPGAQPASRVVWGLGLPQRFQPGAVERAGPSRVVMVSPSQLPGAESPVIVSSSRSTSAGAR